MVLGMNIFYKKTHKRGVGQIWWKCTIVVEIEEHIMYRAYSPSKGWLYFTMSRWSLDYFLECDHHSLNQKDGELVA